MGMSIDSTGAIGRASLFVWQVSAEQEEPWRRFLQELSGSRFEEYADSRRRLGISAQSIWLAPKPCGGGVAVVYLEADNLEWALRELVAAISCGHRTWWAASSFSLGERCRARGHRRKGRAFDPRRPVSLKRNPQSKKEKTRPEGEGMARAQSTIRGRSRRRNVPARA